jgi:hypothetical protein
MLALKQAKPSTQSCNSPDCAAEIATRKQRRECRESSWTLNLRSLVHVLLKPMGRQCKACVSASRRKIDRLLLEGQSF